MKQMLMVAGLGLILGGCATPGELLKRDDIQVLRTAKEPRAVAACLGTKWSEHIALGAPSTVLTEKGYVIALGNSGTVCAAGIEPEGTGSRVRYGEVSHVGRSKLEQEMLDCL